MRTLLFAVFLFVLPLMSAQAPSQGDAQTDLLKLSMALKHGEVGEVKVLHVHDSTLTRTAVGKEALRSIGSPLLEFSHHAAERFDSLLSGVTAKKENHTPDLRWGVFFFDSQGREVGSLFVDKFGQHGFLNDEAVSFETGALAANLAKRLHKITGIND